MKKYASNKYLILLLSALFFFLILATRRWNQLISPQVWNEDGWLIIPKFSDYGISAFFTPVGGYIVLVPKIISWVSLSISFTYYPLISTILTWLFVVMVAVAVMQSETCLQGRFLCALALLVIPSDPEVLGSPLHTLWLAPIFLFLVVIWRERTNSFLLRCIFVVIGGLSSPVIVMMLPLFYARAYWFRYVRKELYIAMLATPIAAIQLFLVCKAGATVPGGVPPMLGSVVRNTLPTFFGDFFIKNLYDSHRLLLIVGAMFFLSVLFFAFKLRKSFFVLAISYLLFGSIALSVARVDPSIIHPKFAGPRYFFFPFVLIFWILIQYFYLVRACGLKIFIGTLIMLALLNATPVWSRQHEDINWAMHARSCSLFDKYPIPIHDDGNASHVRYSVFNKDSCAALMKNDLFAHHVDKENIVYPYVITLDYSSVLALDDTKNSVTGYVAKKFDENDLLGKNVFRVPDVKSQGNLKKDEIKISIRKGDSIFVRNGNNNHRLTLHVLGYEKIFTSDIPKSDGWIKLVFSNKKLPDFFDVAIYSSGGDFAVAN